MKVISLLKSFHYLNSRYSISVTKVSFHLINPISNEQYDTAATFVITLSVSLNHFNRRIICIYNSHIYRYENIYEKYEHENI